VALDGAAAADDGRRQLALVARLRLAQSRIRGQTLVTSCADTGHIMRRYWSNHA
jgi:hypothetical protein